MTVGLIGNAAVAAPPDGSEAAVRNNDPPPKSVQSVSQNDSAQKPANDEKKKKTDPLAELGLTAKHNGTERHLRLRIEIDSTTGRYVYFGVDSKTGEVVNQYPPKDILERMAFMRKVAGLVIDHKT